MPRLGIAAGVLIAAAGVVWMLQGLNSRFAPNSFMTGSREWILFGAITVVAGLWLANRSRKRL